MSVERATGRVLVVEDDFAIAGVLADVLEDEGYAVAVSDNGDAVAVALAEPPGLVLLDAMMPRMDGPEVCRRLRADPRTRDVPVVFVTALPGEVLARRADGCTYQGLIRKPFTLDDVLAAVRRYLPD
ncbi:MAG: response regulator [Chloroflexota bacterium]|nr:response regulator [Chloroflexota bacterium]